LAVTEPNTDIARKWLLQSETEFQFCMTLKERDQYGHSGLADLYLRWSRRPKISVEEANEYLQRAEGVVAEGLKVVSERTSLLIISAEIQRELGNKPAQLAKLREAVANNSASKVGRYLLGRVLRTEGNPQKAMEVLEPVIRTDFNNVEAYLEYTRAMLDAGEPISKCVATLGQCKLDGESEPAFVGLYGGLLYMDEKYGEAKALWDKAKDQGFSDDDVRRPQFRPMDPDDLKKRRRFEGVVQLAKPSFLLLQRDTGPVIVAKSTQIDGKPLNKGDEVSFELVFSVKGAFADHLNLM